MNNLCADIGYNSILHAGEQLCGDHVEVVEQEDGSTVIVLADGLGSGVKASILSTLTSKIIATMMSEGLSVDECVRTIAGTLPVTKEHGVAYSTFTILHFIDGRRVNLIQYDNPHVILIRDGAPVAYPETETTIEGKKIYESSFYLRENDLFVAMSDGCPYASADNTYNYDWKESDIAEFMAEMSMTDYTAKALSSLLVNVCKRYYGGSPRDDATAVVVRMRPRVQTNVLFGPPVNRDDTERMLNLFFSKKGKYIICGGTTASIAAQHLHKPLESDMEYDKVSGLPPTSTLEGVDLVTEGVLTMSRVLAYAKDYMEDNSRYEEWSMSHDGASQIAQMLFEEATDIDFFVGRAMNPAHQNPALPLSFNVKVSMVEEMSGYLRKMGKKVKISYF